MTKKEIKVRFSLLEEEQLERMVWAEPEKWGIKKELLAMCEGWADALEVEKVSDNEFTVSFDLDINSDCCDDVSSLVTFNYRFDEDDVIDVSDYLQYPEFQGIEDMFWEDEDE